RRGGAGGGDPAVARHPQRRLRRPQAAGGDRAWRDRPAVGHDLLPRIGGRELTVRPRQAFGGQSSSRLPSGAARSAIASLGRPCRGRGRCHGAAPVASPPTPRLPEPVLRVYARDFADHVRLQDFPPAKGMLEKKDLATAIREFGAAEVPITHMTPAAVVQFLDLMEASSLEVCLDGGWGIDALLGEQTREHGDLDIILRVEDVPRLVAVTGAAGYARQPGGTDTNFVLKTQSGHEIDVHAIRFDRR